MNYQDIPLRGMQLPEQIGLWPLAFGWWLLIALVIMTPIVFSLYRRWRVNRLSTASLLALSEIKQQFVDNKNSTQLASSLSVLIRKVVLSLYSREQVASITGMQWLILLDSLSKKTLFVEGCGQQIFTNAYSNSPLEQPEEVIKALEKWIVYVVNHPKKGGLNDNI